MTVPSDRADWEQRADDALAKLEPFQRRTAEYVVDRMYAAEDPAYRFLVADEVGLGKTWVARGVIAEVIRRRKRPPTNDPRVDIVYICPNAQIANQNVDRLKSVVNSPVAKAQRLSLLAARVGELGHREANLICITPGTSGLRDTPGAGTFRERALIAAVVRELFPEVPWTKHVRRIFHHGVRTSRSGTPDERLQAKINAVFSGAVDADGYDRLSEGRLWPDDPLITSMRRIVKEDDRLRRERAKIGSCNAPGSGDPDFDRLRRRDQLIALRDHFRIVPDRGHKHPYDEAQVRWNANRLRFIGDFRMMLAHSAVRQIRPDLIILDEFQRFGSVLDLAGGGASEVDAVAVDASEAVGSVDDATDVVENDLVRELFGALESVAEDQPRVLLLSATPFRAFGRGEDGSRGNRELRRVVRFLSTEERAREVESLLGRSRNALATAASASFDGDNGAVEAAIAAAAEVRDVLEQRLRKVMVRTERVGATADRDSMLVDRSGARELKLGSEDLDVYRMTAGVSDACRGGDVVEYWKACAYPLSFMSGYTVGQRIHSAQGRTDRHVDVARLAAAVRASSTQLSRASLDGSEQARWAHDGLRRFVDDVFASGSDQWLWLPPSLPYYSSPSDQGSGPGTTDFTKRLVFSSWRMVPRMLGALLSNEHETRLRAATAGMNLGSPRLEFPKLHRGTRRPAAMEVLALVVPWSGIASYGDPRAGAEAAALPELGTILRNTADGIREALRPYTEECAGREAADSRWYWAGLILLELLEDDRDGNHASKNALWWNNVGADTWRRGTRAVDGDESDAREGGDSAVGFEEHLALARDLVRRWGSVEVAMRPTTVAEELGSPPDDLFDVLATIAIGSPAVCALRSARRVFGSRQEDAGAVRAAAARTGWAFRTLFRYHLANLIVGIHEQGGAGSYWRRVMRFGCDEHLQAVLDEYFHVLSSWSDDRTIAAIAERAHMAIEVGAASVDARIFDPNAADDIGVLGHVQKLPTTYASTFGSADTSQTDQGDARLEVVRTRFNSPFWPFVVASTSVGQEGLDFHLYSHAVVHWNLPATPVELEQREGRVQRRLGHAVRKNVARDFRRALSEDVSRDPWKEMFDAACAQLERTGRSELGMAPWWVYSPTADHAKVERYVRYFPFSRDESRFAALIDELAAYRLTFGQPRQDDLLRFLNRFVGPDEVREIADRLRVDLSPPES